MRVRTFLLPSRRRDRRWWSEAAQVVGSPGGPACQPRLHGARCGPQCRSQVDHPGLAEPPHPTRRATGGRDAALGRSRPQGSDSYASGLSVGSPAAGASRPPDGAARRVAATGAVQRPRRGRSERSLRGQPPLVPRPCCAEQVASLLEESAARGLLRQTARLCSSVRPRASWLGAYTCESSALYAFRAVRKSS